MFDCDGSVLGACSHDNLNAGLHQTRYTFRSLLVGQQGPITHGTTIHDRFHSQFFQFCCFADQSIVIGCALTGAWGHQCGNASTKHLSVHRVLPNWEPGEITYRVWLLSLSDALRGVKGMFTSGDDSSRADTIPDACSYRILHC